MFNDKKKYSHDLLKILNKLGVGIDNNVKIHQSIANGIGVKEG